MGERSDQRRMQAYELGRRVCVAVGAAPLLGVYLLVHTPWLKTQMQEHKHLIVVLLIVLPLAWLWALAQGWRRLGPRLCGLTCPNCGTAVADLRRRTDAAPDQCPHCAAPLRWDERPQN